MLERTPVQFPLSRLGMLTPLVGVAAVVDLQRFPSLPFAVERITGAIDTTDREVAQTMPISFDDVVLLKTVKFFIY